MREQGCATVSPDASGRVLDRLAGLEKIISPEIVREVLRDTGRMNVRSCPLTHEIMLWVVWAMGLLTDLPIRQVFRHARRLRATERAPQRSSLCEARQRLGEADRAVFRLGPGAGPSRCHTVRACGRRDCA